MHGFTRFKLQPSNEAALCDTEATVAFALICPKRKTNRCVDLYADINLQIGLGAQLMSSIHEAATCNLV